MEESQPNNSRTDSIQALEYNNPDKAIFKKSLQMTALHILSFIFWIGATVGIAMINQDYIPASVAVAIFLIPPTISFLSKMLHIIEKPAKTVGTVYGASLFIMLLISPVFLWLYPQLAVVIYILIVYFLYKYQISRETTV